MKATDLKILPTTQLNEFCNTVDKTLLMQVDKLEESELSIDTFSFYTSVSAVYSSKIEGENIDLDSFVKHKRFGIEFLPDYTRKIDDLYNAYQFAKAEKCNKENIEEVHRMLTKHILTESRQGKMRTGNMYVTTADGKIEYVAVSPFAVKSEMQKFYDDLELLMKEELSLEEIFYFSSLLHLVFVKIHPFDDSNGRTSRLIEKWFLAEKLGKNAWLIQSEKNYYTHHQLYYRNIRQLGWEYETLDYTKALPFLLMLPDSLKLSEVN